MGRLHSRQRGRAADGDGLPRRAHGFTLLELLVTLALMVILTSVAAPAFNGFIANQGAKTGAQALLTSLSYARSEAIRLNGEVHLVPADSNDWAAGWIVTADDTLAYADCTAASAPEDCLRVHQGDDRITITGPGGSVAFNSQGRSDASGTFELCDAEQTPSVTKRLLRLDLSGRPNLSHDGNCAP